jgi:hypothetical protein
MEKRNLTIGDIFALALVMRTVRQSATRLTPVYVIARLDLA